MIKPTCRKSSARSSPLLSYFLLIAQPASQPASQPCNPFLTPSIPSRLSSSSPSSRVPSIGLLYPLVSIFIFLIAPNHPLPLPHPHDPPHPLWWPRWRPLTKTYYPGRYTATPVERDRLWVSKRLYLQEYSELSLLFFPSLLRRRIPMILSSYRESRCYAKRINTSMLEV